MSDDENDVFTCYFRAAMEGSLAAESAFEAMWAKLYGTLRNELRRSSMRSSPPSFAGLLGYGTWEWRHRDDPEPTLGPLDELASAAYEFVVGQRWQHITEKITSGCENIDGYVVLYVRDFLRQRRQRNDPVGYKVFTSLRRAVRHAVRDGGLYVISGPQKVGNDTFLGIDARASVEDAATPESLGPLAALWTAELLPDLVTARAGARRVVIERLGERIRHLGADGIRSFRMRDLLGRLQREVRNTWAGVLEEATEDWAMDEAGQIGRLLEYFLPRPRAEEAERLESLVACVSDLLDRLHVTRPTRGHLDTLWGYLQSQSRDEEQSEAVLPSRRGLAKVLKIPRNQIGKLFKTLGEQVERCRGRLSGTVTPIDALPSRNPEEKQTHAC